MGLMLRKIKLGIILFLAVSASSSLKAQSIEKEFENLTNCIDIEIAALKIVPSFYLKEQFDSIELVLDFVKIKCFQTEALRITSLLLAIQNKNFSDTMMSSSDIYIIEKETKNIRNGHLHDFKHFFLSSDFKTTDYTSTFSNLLGRQSLEMSVMSMIIRWSNDLLYKRNNLSSLEITVLEHIASIRQRDRKSRNLFKEVNRNSYNNSRIRNEYDKYHDNFVLNRANFVSGGYTHWFARGEGAKVYGNLPAFYLKIGRGISKRERIDMYTGFRLGNSKLPINIVTTDTIFSSNKASSFLWGLDYVRSILRPSRKLDISLLVGIGVEERIIYSELSEDSEVYNEPEDIINAKTGKNTYARLYTSVGAEINYFIKAGLCFNVGTRYLLSNKYLKTSVTTDISGNSLLIQFGISKFFNGHPARRSGFWNLQR